MAHSELVPAGALQLSETLGIEALHACIGMAY